MYIYVCMYTVNVYICMYVYNQCIYVCMYTVKCIYTYVCIQSMYIYIYMYVYNQCIYIYMYVCMYTINPSFVAHLRAFDLGQLLPLSLIYAVAHLHCRSSTLSLIWVHPTWTDNESLKKQLYLCLDYIKLMKWQHNK